MDEGSSQAVLVAAAAGLSAGIEPGYWFALHVDHLGTPVDPETTVRIVPDRIKCRRIEWRFFDPIHRCIGSAPELRIATVVYIRVPLRHRFHKVREWHSLELMTAVNLRGQFGDRIGAEEEAIGRRCEWWIDLPFVTLNCSAVEDRPDWSGEEVWSFRTFVHRQRGMNAIGLSVGRLDVCRACIAPIHLHVLQPRFGLALAGIGREGGATLLCSDEHFVEESLPHLVDNDQVLEGSVGKVDARGSPERERRMAWKHVRVGVPRGQVSRDMERAGVREVLLHPCEVRPDPHSGDDPAGVLAARSQQGPAARHESRLSERRVEHAAKLRIGPVTSGANDDRLPSPDVYRLGTIVDVAVLPEALQTSTGLWIEPRRIAGPDTHNAARELLLANNLIHVAVEYEPHTFFTSAELQTPRQCRAVRARAFAGDEASVLHHTWLEVTRTDATDSGILFRDCSLLDVRSGAFHQEGHSPPRAGHSSIAVRSEYPAKADVIRHEKFSSGGAVVGVGPMQLAFVVSIGCLSRGVHNRPICMVSE